ncbi:MAG: hypothetical protein R3242_05905, partial [Akkermansiaceae bacterium]|nr:hypothetical protein [Akkermansiaceae bacterium]
MSVSFVPGDRVIAVNTDMSQAMNPASGTIREDYHFPDGVLTRGVVYHVAAVVNMWSGQGVHITGLRAFLLEKEIPWCSSRFRKVDSQKGHVPVKDEQPME